MRLRPWFTLLSVTLAVLLVSCNSTTPTTPSPVFVVEGPDASTPLRCPADVELIQNHNQPVPVLFAPPSIPDIGSFTKNACTPESGSPFPIGATSVTCSATEAEFTTSCTFSVTVLSRTLSLTSFLAFGDSITSGAIESSRSRSAGSGRSTSYPAQLEAMLVDRYPDQTLMIVNAGEPGELAEEGAERAPRELDRYGPEVMLLLEGINQLALRTPARVARALDSIVRSAQRRAVQVLIATLTPIGDAKARGRPTTREAIADLNRQIREIARTRNLGPVVDLFGAMKDQPHLLGNDGLHPTAEGYRVMANEFLHEIVSRYERIEGNESP